jgi:hypothetical protein
MSGGGGTYTPGIGLVSEGIYACTPCPDSDGGMYAGCCSLGLITVVAGCCCDVECGYDTACSTLYIEPGRLPCDGGKWEPPGVVEGGGGGAPVLYPPCTG